MTTLLLATRNAHKAREIQSILGDGFRCLTLNDFPDAPAVHEDADTFAGNATKKASELAGWLSTAQLSTLDPRPAFVLADDSGLEVDALGGAPGVHSARFAALDSGATGNSTDVENNAKLLRLLRDVSAEKRTARFRCVLALVAVEDRGANGGARPPGAPAVRGAFGESALPVLFEGVCEGRIGFAPRGPGGFGYDPLFIPTGYEQTFAELGEAVKDRLSHRARALEKLKDFLEGSASSLP